MKILMIAPEPFFEPRGTPFSEYYRIKALSAMGHEIDLVTYPIGEDKKIKGLKIFRCMKPPFIRKVKTGPSACKLFLDFFLFLKIIPRIIKGKYQLIHTHEEANIMGAFFSKLTGIPHLYDMHSSLVQQMDNFKFTKSKLIVKFFRIIEKISLNNAKSVIVICKSLFEYASEISDKSKFTIIENFIDETPESFDEQRVRNIRNEISETEKKIIMYTGTLETYQGIPLLLESLKLLDNSFILALVGGKEEQIKKFKTMAEELAVSDKVKFMGIRPSEEIPYLLKASDVLVSPRILGTNIPLKIYQYLKSAVPVVATDLYTHTQSMTPEISILKKPEPDDFAEGIREAVSDHGKKIAENAAAFCKENYSLKRYHELVEEAVSKAVL